MLLTEQKFLSELDKKKAEGASNQEYLYLLTRYLNGTNTITRKALSQFLATLNENEQQEVFRVAFVKFWNGEEKVRFAYESKIRELNELCESVIRNTIYVKSKGIFGEWIPLPISFEYPKEHIEILEMATQGALDEDEEKKYELFKNYFFKNVVNYGRRPMTNESRYYVSEDMWQSLHTHARFTKYIEKMFEEGQRYLEEIKYYESGVMAKELERLMQEELDQLAEDDRSKIVEICWSVNIPSFHNIVKVVD